MLGCAQVKQCSLTHLLVRGGWHTDEPSRNTALPHSFQSTQSYRNRFENCLGDSQHIKEGQPRARGTRRKPPLLCRTVSVQQHCTHTGAYSGVYN